MLQSSCSKAPGLLEKHSQHGLEIRQHVADRELAARSNTRFVLKGENGVPGGHKLIGHEREEGILVKAGISAVGHGFRKAAQDAGCGDLHGHLHLLGSSGVADIRDLAAEVHEEGRDGAAYFLVAAKHEA